MSYISVFILSIIVNYKRFDGNDLHDIKNFKICLKGMQGYLIKSIRFVPIYYNEINRKTSGFFNI